ncbi:hypothetical protein [Frigoribacterium sp. CG_9.8]|uniref:hypothetical protein n=1 Tax=Frigoribacterium sp. CG_9.8 TaxID=2787733 RepID=UPI0018C960DD|nr:hypothetical protein [Frigoribacterium sp. CG_9.8]MBG6106632.1 hypothetical protein [Frigoribacterium sp. CG_9.8]
MLVWNVTTEVESFTLEAMSIEEASDLAASRAGEACVLSVMITPDVLLTSALAKLVDLGLTQDEASAVAGAAPPEPS